MVATAHPTNRTSRNFTSLYAPQPIAGNFAGKHIVTVEQFDRADLEHLIDATFRIRERVRRNDLTLLDIAAGRVMATLFYEASTRTDMSFQAAMLRLGGEVIATSGGVQFSSVYKGENLSDTVRAVGCYANIVVLRHPDVGSSFEAAYYLDQLGRQIDRTPVVISAGDGVGEHPTQALLDLFTIVDSKGDLNGLQITMVGDLRYGRTVHSLSKLLARFEGAGVTLNFVAPEQLQMPAYILEYLDQHSITYRQTEQLDDVIATSDVIYWTRIQEERFPDRADYEAIADRFIMTPDVFANAGPNAILMHPLPRKHEMGTTADHDILDADPRSIYFRQMENGMFVRMVLLALTLGATDI